MNNDTVLVGIMQHHLLDLQDGLIGAAVSQYVGDGLFWMAQNQKTVSLPVEGCIPGVDQPVTKDMLRTYSLAMIIELTEFVQELNWKPWKDKKSINTDKVKDEFADILAFMGILVGYLEKMGITPQELGEAYRQKSIVNVERFLGQHGIEYQQVLTPPEEK